MRIVDTHAHLYGADFKDDLGEVVGRARKSGVTNILLPNIDESSIDDLKYSVGQFPDILIPMMGLHPTSVTKEWEAQLDVIYRELMSNKFVAVGEIGLDLYWDVSLREEQVKAFEKQLIWSIYLDLPVAIHSRNAIPEVIASVKKIGEKSLRGVFHSFGGTIEELQSILELKNFMIGINGVITFKNSGLRSVLLDCGLEKILLETDSPYLSPVPYRGKRNEPAYLSEVLKQLSDIYHLSEEEIASATSENAKQLFGIETVS